MRTPEPLRDDHSLAEFTSGTPSLDLWLKRRAFANQISGASRSFVIIDAERVIAYYALASGAITVSSAQGRFRRNMPDPIPVALLARLAVDKEYQRRGIGRGLFRDAGLRVLHAAEALGIRGIVTHAISAEAKRFYLALGFDESPLDAMTLMVTLSDLRAALA